MSQSVAAETTASDVEAFLTDVVFDSMPSEEFDEVLAAVPDGGSVAINLVPDLGLEPTIDCAERAAALGYDAIPHVAARFVEDRAELDRVADRLVEAGVTDIFVPGGSRDEPVGEFASAHELLVALSDLGYSFEDVGIAGYPTGHQTIDDATLAQAMVDKTPHATYLTTQLTFDAGAIRDWILSVRDRGIDLPVEVGIPGVIDYRRLMTLSRKWGAAQPLQFVRQTTGILGFVRKLVGSWGRYSPDEVVAGLAPHCQDDRYGFHRTRFYTFNQIADTERWRRERLNG